MLLLGITTTALGQSGKIAGRVTDAATGDALPGVNVTIEGTTQGTSTDLEGYYAILNVKPGVYAVRASFIGFAPQVVQDVGVQIDQTTTINYALREETFQGEEIVVVAERPVVQPDVSNSQVNINFEKVETLPVSDVASAVALQAGIVFGADGPLVRGSDATELSFNLNGLRLIDERNNTPFLNIPLSAVDNIQVQTGGFNAEYGNVRSGVINVVTKEGNTSGYSATATFRYSPPAQKHFGPQANDPDSYWIRPYIDPDVAWTGTKNGAWDRAMQDQYPEFSGWIALSEERLRDDDPSNDLTPQALQQAFLWQHRKQLEITDPDYTLDVGFGGALLPTGSGALGNARFYASYRRDEELYLIPLSDDRYASQVGHVKITSDVGVGMKLSLEGLMGETTGTTSERNGSPGIFRSAFSIADELDRVSFIDTRIFSTDYWNPTRIRANMVGLTFTHATSQNTFYEVRATRIGSKYDTFLNAQRNPEPVVFFGGVGFDEAPFGFEPRPTFGVEGMRTGVGISNARDTSRVTVWNLRGDLTSQLNRFLQVKTGFEYNLTDSKVNYAQFDEFLPSGNFITRWDEAPVRGAAYGQGKLEFQGMIANLGLRLDYFNANTDWFVFDPFTSAFSAAQSAGIDTLLTSESTDNIVTLSPRLGVSFPVTEVSKLFFNYGHFRSMPDPNNLYQVRFFTESGRLSRLASPNNPLPKTIAYELGYEQAFMDQFLARVAGYYKDISLQPRLVNYRSRDGQTDYSLSEPNSYEDIRGFEVTFARNRGRWVRGFINYTYMVFSRGFFGFRQINENTTIQRELENSDEERRNAIFRPVPQPYGRLNLDFLTPVDYGPTFGAFRPLADWKVSLIGTWSAGSHFTWTGGGAIPGINNNVQFKDSWGLNLRFSKNFSVGGTDVRFFGDVFNLLNRKQLSFTGFVDGNDYLAYMRSLHLPERPGEYENIPGDDRPGVFREDDVAFQPILQIQSRGDASPNAEYADPIYYERETGAYLLYNDGAWQSVPESRIQQVLDDKAYIDMPNQGFLTFLNPRNVYFGVKLSF